MPAQIDTVTRQHREEQLSRHWQRFMLVLVGLGDVDCWRELWNDRQQTLRRLDTELAICLAPDEQILSDPAARGDYRVCSWLFPPNQEFVPREESPRREESQVEQQEDNRE